MLYYLNLVIAQDKMSLKSLNEQINKLHPLHQKKAPAQPGDWLSIHDEPGQTFEEYLSEQPIRPIEKLNTIYLQPIANFTDGQQKIVELTAEYTSLFFNFFSNTK